MGNPDTQPFGFLLLMGLRGSGKSTVGRLAADRRSQPFIDLDEETASLGGMSATTCFATLGEAHWRTLEYEVLRAVLAGPPAVVALGGGTPIAPGAAEAIEASGAQVVWLDAPDEVLLARIGRDPNRPPLSERSPADEMAAIRAERSATFERLASKRIDASELSPAEVAQAACSK